MALGPLEIQATNQQLEDAMRAEMESKNLACDKLERTLHLAASLIEVLFTLQVSYFLCIKLLKLNLQLAYHDRSFLEKKNMALFNWYVRIIHQ